MLKVDAMSEPDDKHDPLEPTLFAAELIPHRSLSQKGFLALMLVFGGASFAAGVVFWILGAWPVFGFFGLDVAILYYALRANFRHARAREEIHITPSALRFRRISHRGHEVEWTFNPLWVRLEQVSDPDFGISELTLVARERRVSIANVLGPEEKASFARALTLALNAARRGPIYQPL